MARNRSNEDAVAVPTDVPLERRPGAYHRVVIKPGADRVGSRKDRLIAKVVGFITRSIYRDVEVHWASPPPSDVPMLSVSNHFGGVSDALVLIHVMPRRPGIVARDVIWKVPVVGRLLTWVGGIPVHKPEDRGSATANDEMFSSCYEVLGEGGNILIFPEGVTRNEPSIAPVKTGAARIALGARAHGAVGVHIVPVGIHYEDKAALRSRVFVNGGVPLDVDALAATVGSEQPTTADGHEAVRELTGAIEVGLRRAAPDFANWEEAGLLETGAEIALRSQLDDPTSEVPTGLVDRLANTLADRPAEARRRVCAAVTDYRAGLDGVGFGDAELRGRLGSGSFVRALVVQLVIGAFLLPFALVGAAVNVIPFLIVKLVGRWRVAPSVLATVKPIVAVVAFGVTWAVVVWRSVVEFGWQFGVEVLILLPVYLAAVVVFVERVTLLWRLVRRWRSRRSPASLDAHLAASRAAVVEEVLAA